MNQVSIYREKITNFGKRKKLQWNNWVQIIKMKKKTEIQSATDTCQHLSSHQLSLFAPAASHSIVDAYATHASLSKCKRATSSLWQQLQHVEYLQHLFPQHRPSTKLNTPLHYYHMLKVSFNTPLHLVLCDSYHFFSIFIFLGAQYTFFY